MAGGARTNTDFFTRTLGLHRVKKTVNFDAPSVCHLCYGDAAGTPGSVMTCFPFPKMAPRTPGAGEVASTAFAIPEGALGNWKGRLGAANVADLSEDQALGAPVLSLDGPDGEQFTLTETRGDTRTGWTGNGVPGDVAIRGFHSVKMRVSDGDAGD
jgi:glyoxalase family protein